MQATLKRALNRLADLLRRSRRLAPNGDSIGFPIISDHAKFVGLFCDFWNGLQGDKFLSGKAKRLAVESLKKTNAIQNAPTANARKLLTVQTKGRELGCLFLRQAAGEYADVEAEWCREQYRAISKDKALSKEARRMAAKQASQQIQKLSLEEAVFKVCQQGDWFTCQFESMIEALEWLVDVDEQRPVAGPSLQSSPLDDSVGKPDTFVGLYHWCESKSGPEFMPAFQSHLRRMGCPEAATECAETVGRWTQRQWQVSRKTTNVTYDQWMVENKNVVLCAEETEARQICLQLAKSRGELPSDWMGHVERELRFLVKIPPHPLQSVETFRDWLSELRRCVMLLPPTKRDHVWALRLWAYFEQAAYWMESHGIKRPRAPKSRREAVVWYATRKGDAPSYEPAVAAIEKLLRITETAGSKQAADGDALKKSPRKNSPTKKTPREVIPAEATDVDVTGSLGRNRKTNKHLLPPPAGKTEVKPDGTEQSKAEQYAVLLQSVKALTDSSFTGKHRRVTNLLIQSGGIQRIADVASDKLVGWDHPYKTGVDGYLKLVRPKLTTCGAYIAVVDQELRIVPLIQSPKRRRITKKAASKTRKSAPPKRRQ